MFLNWETKCDIEIFFLYLLTFFGQKKYYTIVFFLYTIVGGIYHELENSTVYTAHILF